MKIEIAHDEPCLVIKEVFSGAFIETSEGHRIGFCMRDDTIEINILPKGRTFRNRWFRVDMQSLEMIPQGGLPGLDNTGDTTSGTDRTEKAQ